MSRNITQYPIQAIPAHVGTMNNVVLKTVREAQFHAWVHGLSERRIPFVFHIEVGGWTVTINPS